MRSNHWLVSVGLLAVAVVVGCAKEAPTGWEFVPGLVGKALDTAEASDSTTRYMANAGCALAPASTAVGTILLPVPTLGVRRFDCHALGADSIHALVRAYHAWVRTLAPGEHVYSGETYWDAGVVASLPCIDGQATGIIEAYGNYQVTNIHGAVLSRGRAGPYGTVLFAECNEFDHSTEVIAWGAWGMNAGTRMSPGPTYPWEEAASGGTPAPPDPEAPPSPLVSIDVSPSVMSISVGEISRPFVSVAYNTDGEPVPTALVWDSDNHAIAMKDDDGTFVGVSAGVTTIRVSDAVTGAVVGTARIEVLPAGESGDSTCKSQGDSLPLLQGGLAPDPRMTTFGPLGSMELQKTLAKLGGPKNAPELGGYIYLNVRTREFQFIPVENKDDFPVCNYRAAYAPDPWIVLGGDSLRFIALMHSHPAQHTIFGWGECKRMENGVLVDHHGEEIEMGPSDPDKATADTFAQLTSGNYVVQRNQAGGTNIYRFGTLLQPDGTSVQLPPTKYLRALGSTGCAVKST